MADFSPQKSADVNLDSSHEAPSLVTAPAQKESKEVHKVKEQIGQAANIESSDTVDEGIDVVGKVSETLSKTISEDDKRSSGSTSGTQFSGMTPAQIRAHLLNNLPTETAMRKQVQKEIMGLKIGGRQKMQLIEKCGEIEFRMTEGSNEFIQLEALLSQFALYGSRK